MKDKVEATSTRAHLFFKAVRVPQAQVGFACRQQTTVGDIVLVASTQRRSRREVYNSQLLLGTPAKWRGLRKSSATTAIAFSGVPGGVPR